MKAFEVQKAHLDNAKDIGDVIKTVWPDSEVNVSRIENVLRDSAHSTMIVFVDGNLAGFVDGFMTTALEGVQRWEVDLLAVRPDYQRRGIASALIEASTREGQARGAEMARGLVGVENAGSQKSFARCGYDTDRSHRDLLVVSSRSHETDGAFEVKAHIFPVLTMNYTGLWIEGQLNLKSLEQGRAQLAVTDLELAGAVIHEEEVNLIHDALEIGYERVGHYQWWQRPLVSG